MSLTLYKAKQPSNPKGKSSRNRKQQQTTKSNTAVGMRLSPSSRTTFLPEVFRCQHKYVQSFVITGGAVGILGTSTDFALNGLYDPYIAAGGHQPYGFDELSPWYNTYTATHAQVNVTFAAPSTGTMYLLAAWRPSAGSFTITGLSAEQAMEKDNVRWVFCPSAPASQKDASIGLGNFSIANLESKTPSQLLADGNYSAGPSGNPALVPRLMLAVGDLGGATASTIALVVEITYTTLWRGRKSVGQS